MEPEDIDAGALACARHTADADTHALPRVRKTLLYDFLGNGMMLGKHAFHKGDSLREHGDVAFEDAFDIVGDGELATFLTSEVRIDLLGLIDACVDLQTFVFFGVFWMIHNCVLSRIFFSF